MKNLAIIPARGGSKRIPRKNIKPFMGKPIIAYSIEAALDSGLFDEVMVSTDDEEIAEVAKKYGAKVPFLRSAETANDYTGLNDVLLEVIDSYLQLNVKFDNFCCILPTAPLISKLDLYNSYDKLINSNFDSVYPVAEFSYPILRSVSVTNIGEINMNWPEYSNTRSQDLKPAYHDAGSYYWVKMQPFMGNRSFDNLLCGAIIMDKLKVQDIDTEEDWKLAEIKYLVNNEKDNIYNRWK